MWCVCDLVFVFYLLIIFILCITSLTWLYSILINVIFGTLWFCFNYIEDTITYCTYAPKFSSKNVALLSYFYLFHIYWPNPSIFLPSQCLRHPSPCSTFTYINISFELGPGNPIILAIHVGRVLFWKV